MIQTQLELGIKPAVINAGLNRSASALSRGLRRNGWNRPQMPRGPGRSPVAGGYRAAAAHKCSQACTIRPRVERRLQPGTPLRGHVLRYMDADYSPEQIAGTLAVVHADTPSLQVSHETIYTAINAMPRDSLRTEVIGWLRFDHARRRPRAWSEDRQGRTPDIVRIHDRPPEIEERLVPRHWEGYLIKKAHNHPAVALLVEHTTLFTVLSRVDNVSARTALSVFSYVLNRVKAQTRQSLTYDQDREMAAHQQLTDATGVKVNFDDPHSPWQSGNNENINGLLREHPPKGGDLSGFTQEELNAIAWKPNIRSCKSLGFKCHAELFKLDDFDFKQRHTALFLHLVIETAMNQHVW